MPNIAIINFCNLRCQYCFADDMIQENSKTMSLDDYRKVLDFVARTPMNHVGIIGGEPTLHPDFEDILKETNRYCRELNTDATLFTNGTELEKYMPLIGDRIGILININSPESQGAEKTQKQMATLDHLADLSWFDRKANCGCNIHMNCTDYSFIWKIVDKYHLDHLRTSVVSPGACYESWRKDKETYYNKMKPIFIQYCKDAIKHHCRLGIDCGHIPFCYFNLEEREIVEEICDNYRNDFCHPVIDITPDFKATACFGAYDPVDIRDFETIPELENYLLLKKNYPRALANCTGKCTTCKKHELLQCQGGCLGFADLDKVKELTQ